MTTTAENLLVRIDATTEQLRREMRRGEQTVAQNTGRMNRSLRNVDNSFNRLNRSVMMARRALGAFGVALSVRGIGRQITQTAEFSAELVDTAENLGMTTTELQRYRAAARDVTIDVGELDNNLSRLARRLGQARDGKGQLADVAEELGLQGASVSEAFEMVADAIADADDATEAYRIGYAAFGQQVDEILPLLRQGRDGIRAFGDQAERTGRVLDEAMVRRGAEAAASINRINDTLRTNMQAGLLAGFTDTVEDLEEVIASEEFQGALDFFGRAMGEIANFAGEAVVQVGSLIAMLRDPSLDNLADLGVLGMLRRQIGSAEAAEPDGGPEPTGEDELIVEIRRARGHVPPDVVDVLAAANEELEQYNRRLGVAEQIGHDSGRALSQSFEDAIFSTDSLAQSLANVAEELARIILRAQVLEPLGQQLGAGIGGLFSPSAPASPGLSDFTGLDVSGLDFLNAPGRASGGPVREGRSYLVGEQGPELLHMGRNGHVQPNHALGGGQTVNMPVRIENYGNDEVTANRETNERGLEELVITVAARDIQSGGKLGRAVNRVTGTTRRGAQR